jgi:HSP20 family protein
MNPDPKKWNPFKFLRGSGRKPEADSAQTSADGEAPRVGWPDVQRLFSRDSWRAMEDLFLDPFAARGALERWFGDFSSSRFQPRIDVVDEGKILRVSVELPGMERDDLTVNVEDGALVLRGEKKQDVHSEEDGCYRLERPTMRWRIYASTVFPYSRQPSRSIMVLDTNNATSRFPCACRRSWSAGAPMRRT